jgi:hypothetical protein
MMSGNLNKNTVVIIGSHLFYYYFIKSVVFFLTADGPRGGRRAAKTAVFRHLGIVSLPRLCWWHFFSKYFI